MRTRGLGRPRWRSRAAMLVAGILLGALLGELLARLVGFEFRPHMRNRVYFAEPDPLLGWRNRPGFAGPYGGDEFLTWVTINEHGQRGPSHPVERVAGKRRIAVLGDSQTWGDGVADDETFVALLDGGSTEVLSFATPGWGTDQQLLALDNQAARFAPDVVVLALFIGNDLNDNASRGTFQYPKPYFALEDGDRLVLHGVPVPYSRAMHALNEVYRGLMRPFSAAERDRRDLPQGLVAAGRTTRHAAERGARQLDLRRRPDAARPRALRLDHPAVARGSAPRARDRRRAGAADHPRAVAGRGVQRPAAARRAERDRRRLPPAAAGLRRGRTSGGGRGGRRPARARPRHPPEPGERRRAHLLSRVAPPERARPRGGRRAARCAARRQASSSASSVGRRGSRIAASASPSAEGSRRRSHPVTKVTSSAHTRPSIRQLEATMRSSPAT